MSNKHRVHAKSAAAEFLVKPNEKTATDVTHTLEFHGQSKTSDVLIGGLTVYAV